jgi:hypothetical protein
VNRRSFIAAVAVAPLMAREPSAPDPFAGREWVPKGKLHVAGNSHCRDAAIWPRPGSVWWVYPSGASVVYEDDGTKLTDGYDGAPPCAACFT